MECDDPVPAPQYPVSLAHGSTCTRHARSSAGNECTTHAVSFDSSTGSIADSSSLHLTKLAQILWANACLHSPSIQSVANRSCMRISLCANDTRTLLGRLERASITAEFNSGSSARARRVSASSRCTGSACISHELDAEHTTNTASKQPRMRTTIERQKGCVTLCPKWGRVTLCKREGIYVDVRWK